MGVVGKIRYKLARKLALLVKEMEPEIARYTLPEFASNPKNVHIELPRRIVNAKHMELGNDISLGPGCFLMAIERYPGPSMNAPASVKVQTFHPRISIGNGVTATGGLQIAAFKEIRIEDDVMFATNINITDGFHGFQTAEQPYKYQPIWRIAPITVERGCWIGQNVTIMPGVTVGEYSIIGANSVVTKSIPPRSIAVGSPARVVKRWDERKGVWSAITAYKS